MRLFVRYAARHLTLTRKGPPILSASGQRIGRVDAMGLRDNRLVVTGVAQADLVTLELGQARRSGVPGLRATGPGDFRLEVPYSGDAASLLVHLETDKTRLTLEPFPAAGLGLKRALLVPGFIVRLFRALPAVIRWTRDHDIGDRERVKAIFGLGPPLTDPDLDHAVFARSRSTGLAGGPITIVVPVFDGVDLLPDVLTRIVAHTDVPYHLVLIDDASPDPRVRPLLAEQAAQDPERITLLINDRNVGFIASVNRGFAFALLRGHPVVILNTDAFVPPGWASRLLAPLCADPRIASVTPMSNDAELGSVPVVCHAMPLAPDMGDRIDAVARRLFAPETCVDVPTGVGFCMAIQPSLLARVPAFDLAFGKGYGEEVDWCQKTRALGGRHVCVPGLFVEHRGAASFGMPEKRRLLQVNGAIVSRRHPRFDVEVQDFLADDPLITARLALGLAWASAGTADAVTIYLGHALGGGAEHDLERRLRADLDSLSAAVVLRVGKGRRWTIELHAPGGVTRAGTDDTSLALQLLRILPRRRVVYSCAVGDTDPLEVPQVLLALAEGQDTELHVLFHDYFPISPSFTLLCADEAFRGVPPINTTDRAHRSRRPDGRLADLAQWRAAWGALVSRADRLEVFSRASVDLVGAAYPSATDRILIVPHAPPDAMAADPSSRNGQGRAVIGVLGNIGLHKGARVVSDLSAILSRDATADLVLIGTLDPAYRLHRGTRTHGPYAVAEIPALIARYGISVWLIPSIWPETYSFTTHEALATGLPVVCFDLGAQADAVRAAIAAGAPGTVIAATRPDRAEACLHAALALQDGRTDRRADGQTGRRFG